MKRFAQLLRVSRPQQPHPCHPGEEDGGVPFSNAFLELRSLRVLKGKTPLCCGAAGGNPGSILPASVSFGK